MSLVRIEKNPSGRQLLVFGVAWLAFFGAMGRLLWRHGHFVPAGILLAVAALVPLAGAFGRTVPRLAYVGLSYATYPVGLVASYVVLGVVFFLVVTPIGLVMRLLGRDPLSRTFDPGAQTYWVERGEKRTVESYFKQD
jgi:Saxitoxin biosynthesis operon protein SxtJ